MSLSSAHQDAVAEAPAALSKAQAKRNKAQARVKEAEATLAAVKDLLARETWPKEPTASVGTLRGRRISQVVMFTRRMSGRDFTYVATRVEDPYTPRDNGRWYVTGKETGTYTWDQLLEWMGPTGHATLIVANRWAVVL